MCPSTICDGPGGCLNEDAIRLISEGEGHCFGGLETLLRMEFLMHPFHIWYKSELALSQADLLRHVILDLAL